MPAPRESGRLPSRSEIVAWLDRRVNHERVVPASAGGGTFALARMRRLLAALGKPQDRVPAVHLAGTKGKGSTATMLAAILGAAGHRVGLYLSPHVHRLEERICVDGTPITERDLTRVFATVMPVVEALDRSAARRGGRGPTWFEIVTAAALLHFARERLRVAVLETGLGGRLDATNTCRPVLSIITSISLDHMHLLGRTVGKIAAEKAGIIRRGVPVISGVRAPAARRVIATTARRRRAPLTEIDRDFEAVHLPGRGLGAGRLSLLPPDDGASPGRRDYPVAMPGRHQADNAALAVVAARRLDTLGVAVPEEAIARGLATATLPARVEVLGSRPLIVVDAAHNVASITALVETLAPVIEEARPRVLVFAVSDDKQIEPMLAGAAGCFDRVILTRFRSSPRAASWARLRAACARVGLRHATEAESPSAALAAARALAGKRGSICVAGSFYLAAELRAELLGS